MSWLATAIVGTAVVGSMTAPDAPDNNPGMQANAASSERVGMAQVDLAERQRQDQLARNAKLDTISERVANSQLESQRKNDALADEYANYNRTTFRPLEQGIVDEAKNYDTPEEQERVAGQASTAIQKNLTVAKQSQSREMARMGINPNSGRFASTSNDMTVKGALAEAGAENTARQNVRQLGFARRMDAASLGRNLPSSQATSAGLAITAGNSAVNNTAAAVQAGNQSGVAVSGIYDNANSAFGTAGSLHNMSAAHAAAMYGIQAQQHAGTMSSIGSGIGMYAGMKK